MRRLIDLSTPILEDHFRWPVERKTPVSHAKGHNFQVTWIGMGVHGFTHMDSPRHFNKDGFTTDDITLDKVVGECAVVDVSGVGPNGAVTLERIAEAGAHVRDGDIVLMKSEWDTQRSIETVDFWADAPYMTTEASIWLRERGIKAVAFDFPQDHCIRDLATGARKPEREENTTHVELLDHGIVMFEYLCNTAEITRDRVEFFGLPIKLPNADGAPARVMVIET